MFRNVPSPSWTRGVGGSFAVLALCVATLQADAPSNVTRVEEDWELVVLDPEIDNNSPQITCTMSPTGGTSGLHVTFELNHRTQPDYVNGGMQLQMWSGESFWGVSPGAWNHSLHYSGEVITWTQRMEASGSILTFEVDNGHSDSWGNFGGGGNLRVSTLASLTDLAGYSPDVSASLSGVGFGGNRVSSLTLKRVRYFVGNQQVGEDTTERSVYHLE